MYVLILPNKHQSINQALHITNIDRYQSTSARRVLALLNSPQALHITNKDRYQSTSARRALALLNSPLDSSVLHLHGKKKGSSIGLLTLLLIACTSS